MTRQHCAATVLGGPTTVLDLGGLRIVSDPTFDAPGPHGYLTKTVGPAVAEDQLGLAPWTSHTVPRPDGGELTVTAVPAVHGPEDGERDAGAAHVQSKFRDRPLTLDSTQAAAAAAVLGSAIVIPAHYDGWAHFSEGRDDLARAFDDAGQAAQLHLSDHGTWIPLTE
jgi:hypothetical protein